MVTTGNITNAELLTLFEKHLTTICEALDEADFVELGVNALIVHRRPGDDAPY